jgi:MEMO1 family protein
MGIMEKPGAQGAIILTYVLLAAFLVVTLQARSGTAGNEASGPVRKPGFSGSFYPADKATLEKAVDSYLKTGSAEGSPVSGAVFGVIAPHAGYQYSGSVAGFAYGQLKRKTFKTVVIIGPSHQVRFKGVAVDHTGSWETPLGRVRINREMAETLMRRCRSVKPYPPAFLREHSLEVQLPFLQKTLSDFAIVPLATGSMDEADYRSLSDALVSLLKENPGEVLIVASSDMSHYHPYGQAVEMDKFTLADIESLNAGRLAQHMNDGKSELCGAEAVGTLMLVARSLKAKPHILKYANSGDVSGDKSRVVGYGAVAFTMPGNNRPLSKTEQSLLLDLARKTVEASVLKKEVPRVDIKDPGLSEKRGAFVTLTKNGALRGCIGHISTPLPLYRTVSDMSVAAASQDPRFPPVSKHELKDIRIEISVLSPLKAITGREEIEVGTHGLYITKGNYSGLLLPQVALEYNWNRDEFLAQTCHKAGLPPTAWKEKGTTVYIFSAQIFSE